MLKSKLTCSSKSLTGLGEVALCSRFASDIPVGVFVGLSSRNRSFSHSWLKNIARFVEANHKKLLLMIIDRPYAYNDIAADDTLTWEEALTKCSRIGDERQRMVERALGGTSIKAKILRWSYFDSIPWYQEARSEVLSAYRNGGKVAATLNGYVRERVGEIPEEKYKVFARFLMEELPGISYLYYQDKQSVLDIYPGAMFDFYWNLEAGVYRQELPLMSKIADGKSMIFIDYS